MERRMGGLGSGRPCSSHFGTVEGVPAIDVNRLHRSGDLRPGLLVALRHYGEQVGAIHMVTGRDRVNLFYRVRTDDYSREVTETVRLVRVPCRLGGTRPYRPGRDSWRYELTDAGEGRAARPARARRD